jgi:hypothetical protein
MGEFADSATMDRRRRPRARPLGIGPAEANAISTAPRSTGVRGATPALQETFARGREGDNAGGTDWALR